MTARHARPVFSDTDAAGTGRPVLSLPGRTPPTLRSGPIPADVLLSRRTRPVDQRRVDDYRPARRDQVAGALRLVLFAVGAVALAGAELAAQVPTLTFVP